MASGNNTRGAEKRMAYQRPTVTDFGSIARHTFDNPGKGDKSSNTNFETDKFGEYSHPSGEAS